MEFKVHYPSNDNNHFAAFCYDHLLNLYWILMHRNLKGVARELKTPESTKTVMFFFI